ncbi:hypothetical protein ACFQHW_01925 [Lapidilactobacillus achengensis]|uniref:Uncharacterized protein n=1 Tax=Lapidilactobacillus achengensis TaxID=2486000 RepID=A0ABW1UK73_9LACO|nr:hypothetical protein [Lapidilactobacillus achengensis]
MANKMQQKAMHYGVTINQVVERTEQIQEELDPMFRALKDALAADQVATMAPVKYTETRDVFTERSAEYQQLCARLAKGTAPARLMGNHKLLVAAYQDFADGCQAMAASLHEDQTVDQAAFAAAEAQQDDATERMSKYLQRITALV